MPRPQDIGRKRAGKPRPIEGPFDPRHGTMPGYSAGCRCGSCREAAVKYRREKAYVKNRQESLPFSKVRHGTELGYSYDGCRCRQCTDAHNEYRRGRNWSRGERKRK